MNIGIDANEANVEKRVGISEYAYQILSKFYAFRSKNKNEHNYTIYLKNNPIETLPKETIWWKYKVVKPSRMWTQVGLPLALLKDRRKIDLFFTLTHYGPRFSKIPTVVSVMDLSFLHFPETFKKRDLVKLKKWTEYSVKKSKKVITISESSKNDIIKSYKVEPEKIVVVPLGLKEIDMKDNPGELKDFGINSDFILFVGTLQPRKNIKKLIEAYSLLPQKAQDANQLVIIGKKGWLFDEILDAPNEFGVTERVLFLDYVKNADLPLFYKKARVYVLPSLYEGFGLPILEAMSYGCPVITSNVSSMPEAGGDAALYFDPENAQEISKTIEKVLTDKNLRDEMIKKGNIHYKKFTWDKAANDVLKALESVV